MKYVTFNIRYDCGEDGINNFEHRKPLILKAIEDEQPDVIGFQEVLPHVVAWLKRALADYTVVGCGRSPELDGEQVSVAFRRDRFNLVELRTFWLSETPFVPGSRYANQSDCPRVAAEALLCELATGRVFRVLNTHLDHIGSAARRLGLEQLLRHIDAARLFPDAPVILAGDFNAPPDSEEMRVFAEFPGYANATEGIGTTYHGYMNDTPECIDYIWLRGGMACRSARKWTRVENGVFLSDHYPICAELEWR